MNAALTRRLCYISRNYYNIDSAGNKAKSDYEDIVAQLGGKNLGLKRSYKRNKAVAFVLNLAGVVKSVCCLRRDDVLFLQYPVKKYFTFLCRMAHLRGAKTVCLIHDLGSCRRKKLTIEQELRRLSHADYVIATNNRMADWLKENGLKRPVGSLGLHDYLSPSPVRTAEKTNADRKASVVYAGSLSMKKNAFFVPLSQVLTSFELAVYGNKNGLTGLADNPHITWHDFEPADEFIRTVEGDFGLVWDGDSKDTCSGSWGEYLRLNTPHKASFYLRAGLPLIVWKESAIAPIIEKEGIGFSVASLDEIPLRLRSLASEDLEQMKHKATKMAERINQGDFLRQAILAVPFV